MMQTLPVIAAAVQGYKDAWFALKAMPFVAAVAFAVSLGQGVFEYLILPPVSGDRTFFEEIVALLLGGIWSFLFTPFLIAVHRFVILGEKTSGYKIDMSDPRLLRFFFWSFGLLVLFSSVLIFSSLVGVENALTAVVAIAGALMIVFIGLRIIVLFPAIAVDAPGVSFENAFADTKGHMLRIILILFLTALPLMVAAIFSTLFIVGVYLEGLPRFGIPLALISAASSTFFGAVFVAVASRLYQALGRRLNQPR